MMKALIKIGYVFATLAIVVAVTYMLGCGRTIMSSGLEYDGKNIIVKRGGSLQAAINAAKPGDTILLEAGTTFAGAVKLPKKSGEEFITIRSSADDAKLPKDGERIDPSRHASLLPKIISDVKGEPAIETTAGAHHFRFVAVEFGPTIEGLYDIIKLGTGKEKRPEDLPHHIEFDRIWVHGSRSEGQRRGIAANGRHIKIVNSYISDIKRKGDESQAIAVWASDGPVEIVNNYLEAAAENILLGGSDSVLRLVPTGCIVDSNHLNKPLEWRREDWVVKNLFEIKNGKNIKVTNNLMTNNWAMGQDGNALLFTTRADNGDATIIDEITFEGNIVRGAGGGMNILGNEGSGGHRLYVRNNIFDDIDGEKWGGSGHFMKVTDWNGLVIENNTIIQKANITNSYGKPVRGFIFRNNIIFENEYGIKGENMGSGQPVIDKFFSGGSVTGNLFIGGKSSSYRERNGFPVSLAQIGFENINDGAYRLKAGNPYLKAGFENRRIGADLDPAKVGRK